MKIEAGLTVDRPLTEVWEFMTNWSNFREMNPAILKMRETSAGPLGVGTTLEVTHETRFGNRATYVRVIGYEPNRSLTLEHVSGPSRGTRTIFGLENVEGKTRLTCLADVKLSGFYRLIGPFVAGRARREVSSELSNLERTLASQNVTGDSVNSLGTRPSRV